MRYGRLRDDYSRPKLDLTDLAASADFSMIPPVADYAASYAGLWRMLGNGPDDNVAPGFPGCGDCEAARWANSRLLVTGAYPVIPGRSIEAAVIALYRTQNPDFDPTGDPTTTGPGSPADGGMATDVLCDDLHRFGGPDGVKLVCFGVIDPTNITAVERALGAFGGLWVDILVQPGNQTEFADGAPWTDTGEPAEGAHAVLAAGYIPQRRFVTWAAETTFADSFWSGRIGDGALVERVYLPIWPEHATHTFIASETAQLLADQYQALTGRPLVWPATPTPTPTPPAPPTPPPTPDPVPAPPPAPVPPAPAPPAPVPAPPAPTPPDGGGASFLVSDPAVVARVQAVASRRHLSPDDWLTQHLSGYFAWVDEWTADAVNPASNALVR